MGRRQLNQNGWLVLSEGDYGKGKDGKWSVRPPGCRAGGIPEHEVVEHSDGTITVRPSILLHNEDGSVAWHGYLEKGVWRQV